MTPVIFYQDVTKKIGDGCVGNNQPRPRVYTSLIFIVLVGMFLTGCRSDPLHSYTYHQPEQVQDGLDIGSLVDVSMDIDSLESAMVDINSGGHGDIHSLQHLI